MHSKGKNIHHKRSVSGIGNFSSEDDFFASYAKGKLSRNQTRSNLEKKRRHSNGDNIVEGSSRFIERGKIRVSLPIKNKLREEEMQQVLSRCTTTSLGGENFLESETAEKRKTPE